MKYDIQFKPKAVRDIEGLPSRMRTRVLPRIGGMSNDLKRDVKRLINFTPEYRLRIGDY